MLLWIVNDFGTVSSSSSFHFFYYFTSNSFSCLMSIVKSKEQTESKVKIPPRAHLHRQRAILKSFNFLLHRCYACLIFQLSALDELQFQQDIKKNTKQSFAMRVWIVDQWWCQTSYHNLMMMELEISQTTKLECSNPKAHNKRTTCKSTRNELLSDRLRPREQKTVQQGKFSLCKITLLRLRWFLRPWNVWRGAIIAEKLQELRVRHNAHALDCRPDRIKFFFSYVYLRWLLRRALLFGWNMLILITVKHSRSHYCVGYSLCVLCRCL